MKLKVLFSTFSLVVLFSDEEKEAGQEEEEPLTGEEEEERRIAEMGKPMLGDHPKLEVIIEESYEFKVLFIKFVYFKSLLSKATCNVIQLYQFINQYAFCPIEFSQE